MYKTWDDVKLDSRINNMQKCLGILISVTSQ